MEELTVGANGATGQLQVLQLAVSLRASALQLAVSLCCPLPESRMVDAIETINFFARCKTGNDWTFVSVTKWRNQSDKRLLVVGDNRCKQSKNTGGET